MSQAIPTATDHAPPGGITVLVHLASLATLDEIAAALARLPRPHQVIVNLLRDGDDPPGQREAVRRVLAKAVIIESDNRGMDIGGMLRLFQQALQVGGRYWLYLHGKRDHAWRGAMLDTLVGKATGALSLMAGEGRDERHNPVGMVGAWSYPFDYYNIGPFLELAAQLGITLRTSWASYCDRYPEARGLDLARRLAHAREPGRRPLRPEVDVEYATALLGDLDGRRQPMHEAAKARMRADGVLGPLPYFPGNFFWIRADVVAALAACVDLGAEALRLPADLSSDREHQSRAHAWERMLPVFAAKRGYALAALGVDEAGST